MRRKWVWTDHQVRKAADVQHVVEELKPYWPLTLRQVYYRLVSAQKIKNNRSEYNMLSKLVKWMRIDDYLSWNVLEDRSRSISQKRGYEDVQEYVDTELRYFLNGYERCLVQGQENYVEVWTEKDALSRIFEDVTYPYCIRTVVCRGYKSVTFIADFYKRAAAAMEQGQRVIVLYYGDLDPSGVQMLEATGETLENELGLEGVDFRRMALTPAQVERYRLPTDPEAVKLTDTRYKSYVKEYGELSVELDSLDPSILSRIVRRDIEGVIDVDLFHEQKGLEMEDRNKIKGLRVEVMDFINQKVNGLTCQTQ
jgi:hypothetical protein